MKNTTKKNTSSPETIPAAFAGKKDLSSAYRRGWNSGHGIACHNVPTLGEKIFSDNLGRVTVDAENVREIHASSCHEAELNGRDFSPFEFTAHAFNQLGEGGFSLVDFDGETVGEMHKTEEQARAALFVDAALVAKEEGISETEAREGYTVKEMPSANEVWTAYEEGVFDSISADLSTYDNADYGIVSDEEEEVQGENLDGFADAEDLRAHANEMKDKAPADYLTYCRTKADAMECRVRGDIGFALAQEAECEHLYKTLPKSWQW